MGPCRRERRHHAWRRLAAITAVVVVSGVASAPAGASEPLVWSRPLLIDHQQPFSSNHELTDVSCPSISLCVASDDEGDILSSRDPSVGGTAGWTVQHVDGDGEITGISCPSTSFCVAVNYGGDVLTSTDPGRGAAARWEVRQVRGATELESVSCVSRSLCVAVGSGFYEGTHDLVVTSNDPWRGARAGWSVKGLHSHGGPLGGSAQLTGVSCPSPTLCVAAGEDFTVLTSTDPGRGAGAKWTERLPVGLLSRPIGVSCPSRSFCDIGGILTSTDPGSSHPRWKLRDEGERLDPGQVSCASRWLCVAVQNQGRVAVTTHVASAGTPRWSLVDVDGEREGAGVSCVAALCVAIDRNGRVITSTDPALGARSEWSIADVDGFNYLSDVSCTSAHLCVAADHDGTVVSTTDPLGGPSAWRARDVDGTRELNGVSCVALSLCVAVDASGDVVSSTDPAAAASSTWTVEDVDGSHALHDVSCPTTSLCVAVDDRGYIITSTDPGDGPTAAWTALKVGGSTDGALLSVACPTAGLCVAASLGGEFFVSTDPRLGVGASWRLVPGPEEFGEWLGIACPSTSMCVIAGPEIVTLTDPGRPHEAVAHRLLAALVNPYSERDELHGVSCPSTALCLVVEDRGNVLRSTDAGRGRTAGWQAEAVDGLHALWAVSCASPSLCLAVDDHGYVFVAQHRRRHRTGAGAPASAGRVREIVQPGGEFARHDPCPGDPGRAAGGQPHDRRPHDRRVQELDARREALVRDHARARSASRQQHVDGDPTGLEIGGHDRRERL